MLSIMALAAAQAAPALPPQSETPQAVVRRNASSAQTPATPAALPSGNAAKPPKPAPKPINHDEDYSSFRDARDTNLWTRLKYIPIAGDTYASLGGELRLRSEIRPGERFGRGLQDDNGNLQQRTRVWADLQVEGVLRAFVDMEHATTTGLDSIMAPIEEGRLDFNQAFVEARIPIGEAKVTARVGRQEVGIGNQTVFDMREGANTRRSLDVARLMINTKKWDADILTGHSVLEKLGTFDDKTNYDFDVTAVHGGYNFGAGPRTGRIEALFVDADRTSVSFNSLPAARDQRRTMSLRYAGKADAWSIDVEGIRQWGSHGDLDIDAYYVTSTLAHNWQGGWKPRLALRVDVGSGDKNPNDNKMGTYGPMFPRPLTYNGDLGPHNMTIVQPMLTIQPLQKLTLDMTVAGMWRTSSDDAVYSLGGAVIRRGDESDANYFGKRATVAGRYALNPFTTLGLFANYSDVSKRYDPGRDLFYAASYVTFRF